MSSVRIKIHANKVYSDGTSPVGLQVIINRKVHFFTLFSIDRKMWSESRSQVKKSHPKQVLLNRLLQAKKSLVFDYVTEADIEGKNVSKRELSAIIKGEARQGQKLVDLYNKAIYHRKDRTADRYRSSLKKIKDFDPEVGAAAINYDWIREFEQFLSELPGRNGNLSVNTIAKELSILKTVLREGVSSGILDRNPMAGYRIREEKTYKPALTTEERQLLLEYKSVSELEQLSLDAFFLAFYLRGMRASDLLTLRKDQYDGDMLFELKADKTGKERSMEVPDPAKAIIYQWEDSESRWLLPILPEWINTRASDERSRMRSKRRVNSANSTINKALKRIAKCVGINKVVTMHVARHTFAFHADREGLSLSTLRDLLDHSSLNITDVYLRQVRRSAELDEAVRKIF